MNKEQIIKNAVDSLMTMLRTGKLPEQVAISIIRRRPDDEIYPSEKWSVGNRVLQMLQQTEDARGFKQWAEVERSVKKGAHAIWIFSPMTFKVKETDEKTGKEVEKVIVKGFRPIPVYRVEDTEGKPLPERPDYTPEQKPTFFDAADKLGIDVTYTPFKTNFLGRYSLRTNSIRLCSEDAVVYYHELAHGCHARLVDLRTFDKKKAEVVAEFSALVLANIAGVSGFEKQGFDYINEYARDHKPGNVLREIMSTLNDVANIVTTILAVSDDAPMRVAV